MYKKTIFSYSVDPFSILSNFGGTAAWLNSNDTTKASIIALGVKKELVVHETKGAFNKLKEFKEEKNKWLFGYMSYDLKNDIEDLESENSDLHNFPELHFFQPLAIIKLYNGRTELILDSSEKHEKWETLLNESRKKTDFSNSFHAIEKINGITKSDYLLNFDELIAHIQRGDIYEINNCIEFSSENVDLDPLHLYDLLNQKTEAPFSVFYRSNNKYILSGSPERYLKREGDKLISQPIKGTIKRGSNEAEDVELKSQLLNDPKERSENVMIVDLVRNDLSRVALKGSVKVDELFGVYSFKTVHHLISTVSCKLDKSIDDIEVIKATFPMGSMTGAPKVSAMKLIEKHENFKRGVYSGAFGYFTPDGDFDFNVLIRTIIFDADKKVVSFPVGGAITAAAIGDNEYNECLLKAEGMKKAIQNS